MLTPLGVGVLMFVWVLGRTVLTSKHYPRFSFFELNGCHLWLDTYCLT